MPFDSVLEGIGKRRVQTNERASNEPCTLAAGARTHNHVREQDKESISLLHIAFLELKGNLN